VAFTSSSGGLLLSCMLYDGCHFLFSGHALLGALPCSTTTDVRETPRSHTPPIDLHGFGRFLFTFLGLPHARSAHTL